VDAGRAALADLEADEVPASLRRVVSHSGGRLPPPLTTSLLQVLDEDEWLRGLAAAKLRPGLEESAAASFLQREGVWWTALADGLAARRAADAETAAEQAAREVGRVREQLDVAGERLKRAGADLEAERAKSRSSRAPERRPNGGTAALEKATSRVAELRSSLDSAVQDRIDAEGMIARLRARAVSVRREQRRRRNGGEARSTLGESALDLAKKLDLMMAAAPHRSEAEIPGEGEQPLPSAQLGLPAGIRPDARGAIDWLVSLETPVTVIVDGYNVLRNVEPGAFTSGRTRDRLAQDLSRLRRRSGVARVVVVYDSEVPGHRDPRILQGGVEAHFSAEEDLADDEIVNLVSSARGGVVVITSDRDLRERTEALGALTLWSEALNGWIAG
jgi:predicted RNA-binding protein with PIN domain